MAALTAISPANTGTASTGAAVAASDTIAQSVLGPRGAYLEIINAGGSSDTVTVSDYGATPAGNELTSNQVSASVANGASKVFYLKHEQVDPSTNLITVTHSFTTSVTYKLYPLP